MSGEIHDDIKSVSYLLGRWKTTDGLVTFPTMKPFKYHGEMEFSQFGQPCLNYKLMTYEAETNKPMHMESGFLKVKPGSNEVSFLVTHNLGLTELAEGKLTGQKIEVKSIKLAETTFNMSPEVVQLNRTLSLKDGTLHEYIEMEDANHPLQKHVVATFKKV